MTRFTSSWSFANWAMKLNYMKSSACFAPPRKIDAKRKGWTRTWSAKSGSPTSVPRCTRACENAAASAPEAAAGACTGRFDRYVTYTCCPAYICTDVLAMANTSIKGNRYVVTGIDFDRSRKNVVFTISVVTISTANRHTGLW